MFVLLYCRLTMIAVITNFVRASKLAEDGTVLTENRKEFRATFLLKQFLKQGCVFKEKETLRPFSHAFHNVFS